MKWLNLQLILEIVVLLDLTLLVKKVAIHLKNILKHFNTFKEQISILLYMQEKPGVKNQYGRHFNGVELID